LQLAHTCSGINSETADGRRMTGVSIKSFVPDGMMKTWGQCPTTAPVSSCHSESPATVAGAGIPRATST